MKKFFQIFLYCVFMFFITSCSSKKAIVLESAISSEFIVAQSSESGAYLNSAIGSEPSSLELGSTKATIFVHICGEVLTPAVYELEEGLRLIDAVEMAGGFTEEAAADSVNLARRLVDAERVYIPSMEELSNPEYSESLMEAVIDGQEEPGDARVNINTATKEELKTLNGIGDSRADDIISYRNTHGAFKSIEEIKSVPGIKEASFEKIREYIRVN